jgi:uncharacterized protein (TIGR02145 family)
MHIRHFTITLCIAILFISGCKKDDPETSATPAPAPAAITVTDVEGSIYSTITIGSQVWMAENLRTGQYRDGSTIPNVPDNTAWSMLTTGAWSVYGNYAGNNVTYGKLYNWFAVTDPRGLCPQGWHVPSDTEWKQLEMHLGLSASDANLAGYRGETQSIGGKLKSTSDLWDAPNTGATNTSGFSALPGGYRIDNGDFIGVGSYGDWWTSTQVDTQFAWGRDLDNEDAGVYRFGDLPKKNGQCVRCLRD